MNALARRSLFALGLQIAALGVLGAAWFGITWLDPRLRLPLIVLVDRSMSMPRAAADEAVAVIRRTLADRGDGRIREIDFAGRPAPAVGGRIDAARDLDHGATNIAAALDAALAEHARSALERVVVVSDGFANAGDTRRALQAVRDAGLPLQWVAAGRAPPPTRLAEVLAPARARTGQPIAVTVRLAGQTQRSMRVELHLRTRGGEVDRSSAETRAGDGEVRLELAPHRAGVWVVDVALRDPASGQVLDTSTDAAAIEIEPPAALLYVRGSVAGAPLAGSLARGGWAVQVVPAARLDGEADRLDNLQAVVLDDVAAFDAGARFWNALTRAVRERGVGLLVLGGERSFALGAYRGSALEALLPVVAEPAALDQPTRIVFAVDKSGSMGEGSGGVDRFSLARRAVIESVRGLGPRDTVGLLVFDVAPHWLLPPSPADAVLPALEREWRTSPNGGTRLKPALDAAVAGLGRTGGGRRMLVLVTDGFVDEAPGPMRQLLEQAQVETVALAVGPDADTAALGRIVGSAGSVTQVDQAAELPQAMRTGLLRLRGRVERGVLAVRQTAPLPFAPATLPDWPPVAAYAVTRAKPDATVAVKSMRDEPLIAFGQAGRGRVAALPAGLGGWTAPWLRWHDWPRLAGGLASWVAGGMGENAAPLSVTDTAAGLLIDADVPAGAEMPPTLAFSVDTPGAGMLATQAEPYAPGRLRATVPGHGPGLYDIVASTAQGGTERASHLRRQRAEQEVWGTNPELEAWRRAGLVHDFGAEAPADGSTAATATTAATERPADRSLLALALVLALAGVVVDRIRALPLAATLALLRRLLSSSRRPAREDDPARGIRPS